MVGRAPRRLGDRPGAGPGPLGPDQVEALRLFIADVRGALVLEGIAFRWHRRRSNRLVVRAADCTVELRPYDLHELAAFLA